MAIQNSKTASTTETKETINIFLRAHPAVDPKLMTSVLMAHPAHTAEMKNVAAIAMVLGRLSIKLQSWSATAFACSMKTVCAAIVVPVAVKMNHVVLDGVTRSNPRAVVHKISEIK